MTDTLLANVAVPHVELFPLAVVGEGLELLELAVEGVLLFPALQIRKFDLF